MTAATHKLVPVVPTNEMAQVGGHVNSEFLNDNAPIGEIRYKLPIAAIWAAMLAVAPAAPAEQPDALGYVPSDDILLPFMSLIEDYMSAVDYHGGQKGERCDAAEAALRAALVKLVADAKAAP